MVRHIRAARIEAIARPIVAAGNEYPAGHEHPAHSHRRSQFLFAERGTMLVRTEQGAWLVPPSQGIWIPGGMVHGITMVDEVATRSVYLEPDAPTRRPQECQVLDVGPLMRQLLIAAADVPLEYDMDGRDGRLMRLLIDEIAAAPVLPLSLPLPRDERLAARCRRFLEYPTMQDTIESWSLDLALSRRSFTRLFRRETGLSFAAWQRRACILSALPRLSRGERVTSVALDLGYSSPNAFSTMFRDMLGSTPGSHARTNADPPPARQPASPPTLPRKSLTWP
jgi:AraC-like DNA-binding protein/mannose-6-phosphate isomerase-like protein (cupin superfamily)